MYLDFNKDGLLILLIGLSEPIRHLAKYAGMFQEMKNQMTDFDPDRGNVQRLACIFNDIFVSFI